MALDPNISLQSQVPDINPLASLAQIQTYKNAQAQNQLINLGIQDKQREVGQNKALSDAYAGNLSPDGSINQQGILNSLAGSGYGSAIPGVTKQFADAQKAKIDAQKSQIENGIAHLNAVGQVLGGVNDQASYDAAKATSAKQFGPDSIADWPQQYDPNIVQQHLAQTLNYKDQLAEQHAKIADQVGLGNQAETGRHNLATEDNTVRGQNLTAATETRGQNLRAQDYDPKTGAVINKLTGQSTTVTGPDGQPLQQPSANLTETQGAATAFGARAQDSQRILQQLEQSGVNNGGRIQQAVSGIPLVGGALGSAVNALGVNSDAQQSYQQAKQNFISANLRKESGAAISPEEFKSEEVKYFPQPGDSPDTIAQKSRARDLAIEGLRAQAGPGANLIPGIINRADQTAGTQQQGAVQQQPAQQKQPTSQITPDLARAELLRRAQSNPALAARLQAMGH